MLKSANAIATLLVAVVAVGLSIATPSGGHAAHKLIGYLWPWWVIGAAMVILALGRVDLHRQFSAGRREHDQRCLDTIFGLLDESGVVAWLSTHDFNGSFRPEQNSGISEFVHESELERNRFNDRRMEGLRQQLVAECNDFLRLVYGHYYPVEPTGVCRPNWTLPGAHESLVRKGRDLGFRTNQLAGAIAKTHRELVTAARKRGFTLTPSPDRSTE